MASARLDILISARETATRIMEGVKSGFARRIADIQGLSNELLRNGEKVEKFMQLASMAKMATQTEGFKTALDGISPKLNGYINDLTNVAVAGGLAAQSLRGIATLSQLAFAAPVAVGAAIAAGTAAIAQSYLDMKEAQADLETRYQARLFSAGEGARNATSEKSFDLAIKQINEAAKEGIEGARELAESLIAQKRQILAYNRALEAGTKAAQSRADALNRENAAAAANRAAVVQVKAIQREQFRATPQGQFEDFRDTQRNLGDAKRFLAGTDPEKQAVRWLELNKTVEELTSRMQTLNEAPIGQIGAFITTARDRIGNFLTKPRAAPEIKTPGAEVIRTRTFTLAGDSAIRQGLGVGNVRSNLDVSITTRIAANGEKQVNILQLILNKIGLPGGAVP